MPLPEPSAHKYARSIIAQAGMPLIGNGAGWVTPAGVNLFPKRCDALV
jgi:hypothetical protein